MEIGISTFAETSVDWPTGRVLDAEQRMRFHVERPPW